MKDFQTTLERLRRDAAEYALIRDLATDLAKRDVFDKLHVELSRLADEVQSAISSRSK